MIIPPVTAWCLLAQGSSLLSLVPALIIIFVLFYFMLLRPEQRKQQEQKSMLENLKKNDRVVTIGGIYGIVQNVQRQSDEITIKIDETSGTKMKVTTAAIGRVLTAEKAADKEKTESKQKD